MLMGTLATGDGKKCEESIPMILHCPDCGKRHIDKGAWADKLHHTHACQHCGIIWRPAVVPTVGVQFLPGMRDDYPVTPWNGEVAK